MERSDMVKETTSHSRAAAAAAENLGNWLHIRERANMVTGANHSRAAAAAENLIKRLHVRDRTIKEKAARNMKLRAALKDLDPACPEIRARIIWLQAKSGKMPEDDAALTPEVRAQLEVFREKEMAREKKMIECLSSPKAAKVITQDKWA